MPVILFHTQHRFLLEFQHTLQQNSQHYTMHMVYRSQHYSQRILSHTVLEGMIVMHSQYSSLRLYRSILTCIAQKDKTDKFGNFQDFVQYILFDIVPKGMT